MRRSGSAGRPSLDAAGAFGAEGRAVRTVRAFLGPASSVGFPSAASYWPNGWTRSLQAACHDSRRRWRATADLSRRAQSAATRLAVADIEQRPQVIEPDAMVAADAAGAKAAGTDEPPHVLRVIAENDGGRPGIKL